MAPHADDRTTDPSGPPPRLADRVALGALTRTYPPDLVDQVLAACGRLERRHRLLPARLVVYYVLALALFADLASREVLRCLVEALRGVAGWRHPREPWRRWRVPAHSALVQARARLGVAPLRALYAHAVVPLATPATPGAFYRGWRLLALDGTCLDVADTPANAAAFGRPGSSRGEGQGGFPQARLVGLTECGSHAVLAAQAGPYRDSEPALADRLLADPAAGPALAGGLLLVDQGLSSVQRWRRARATGAALLWRVRTDAHGPKLAVRTPLCDGSWLAALPARGGEPVGSEPVLVRVVDYRLDDPGRTRRAGHGSHGGARTPSGGKVVAYRLLTSILDPAQAPAVELAALYHERWEAEGALDELKTHQRGAGAVLRSRTPDGVEQELWAHLLVHYALRALMHQAAQAGSLDPDRLSFTATLRIVRRHTIARAAFSP
ncbi:MAG TPA: IS4 family transposase [Actinomycetes bacterium]